MRAFLDACVLYMPIMRRMFVALAEAGVVEIVWSGRVLEEWARAARRNGGGAEEAAARGEIALLRARWPQCEFDAAPDAEAALTLPDPADAHVLAAALAARADVLVTLNLRDFPARKLRALGLEPIHPDALLWELYGKAPEAVREAAAQAASALGTSEVPLHKAIKKAGMPRLARLLKAA